MVLVPFKQQDLRWLKEILYNEKRVRKGFWKPPPQIWLGDVGKIRVLDPHFLHQTADRLLQIPLHPKSRQKREQWEGSDPTGSQRAYPTELCAICTDCMAGGERKKPVHPTTGILAVFVALNYCDVVHIAGFGYPNSKSQRQPIHYYGYDTMRSMKNSYHDLNHEAEALKRLEDSGAICTCTHIYDTNFSSLI
ncbi:hypothetical protein INR49_021522 [Caranx melampygus]|nr:hypothetical protein INR49_021522 [Caranx melampygus]